MTPAPLLGLVLLAAFAAASLALAGLLTLFWQGGLARRGASSLELLVLRLLPAGGALVITLAVALPAFLTFEPRGRQEAAGPWLLVLAALAVVSIGDGIGRGWRACRGARALLRRCRAGPLGEPLIAVIGAWKPRIVASERVRAACSAEEFGAVLAHERAHLTAHDNLKLLLLLAAPDALAWTPLAAVLTSRWRAAAEREADQRATGADPERRLALAAALIKVARLLGSGGPTHPALGMPVAMDDVSGRVRALLAPPAQASRSRLLPALAGCVLLLPLLVTPGYALLHELIERLVGLGR